MASALEKADLITTWCHRQRHWQSISLRKAIEAIAPGARSFAQSLAYFYARENDNDANTAGALTMDEARRLASNFAKLPAQLGRG